MSKRNKPFGEFKPIGNFHPKNENKYIFIAMIIIVIAAVYIVLKSVAA